MNTSVPAVGWVEVRNRLASVTGARATEYQALYRSDKGHAKGSAILAQLRRGIGKEPGDLPRLWGYTELDEDDFGPQYGQHATAAEWAVHLALTMFALHQQSHEDRTMHVQGTGLGTAVGRLQHGGPSPEAVRRRFTAAGTAIDITELTVHLRGLITQMRQRAIGLDYGRLAADLFAWQNPEASVSVRRAWGRDLQNTLHRLERSSDHPKEDQT